MDPIDFVVPLEKTDEADITAVKSLVSIVQQWKPKDITVEVGMSTLPISSHKHI